MEDRISYRVFLQQDKIRSLNGHGVLYPPHYDRDFQNSTQAIFLAERFQKGTQWIPEASYEYSDRFSNWFVADAITAAWAEANRGVESRKFDKESAAYYESWLRSIYQDPDLELVHILVGLNASTGHPYRVYGFLSHQHKRPAG